MKTLAFAFCALLISLVPTSHAVSSINLSTFGSSVQADQLSYDPSTSTITGTEVAGGLLYPTIFTPVNLTTLDNYNSDPANLRLSLSSFRTTPTIGNFSVTLEGGVGKYVSTVFSWGAFNTSTSTVIAAINPDNADSGFEWNNIVGWTWDSGGSGSSINATFTSLDVAAIPEPSTYALLALSGLALGGYVIRRRRRA